MTKYQYTYVREQRVFIDVEANNIEEAARKAWDKVNNLNLDSEDDHSDDLGDLWLDNIVSDYE